ncbi:hypothetical protein B0A79_12285 [Flavobacterium piscis]|uniref:Uncharacterized protein n=1 Tax=Flavobacterium piscis TaxID=1114874 RepID=A0ABX2XUR5_9FLAO|nr:hypothetical protein FLP_01055 [Flavobacterium piscis]OXG04243.1 hypothetical protein B0A79_12285 [Flavobacterium piscis]
MIECEKYEDYNNQKGQQFIGIFPIKIIFPLLIFQKQFFNAPYVKLIPVHHYNFCGKSMIGQWTKLPEKSLILLK